MQSRIERRKRGVVRDVCFGMERTRATYRGVGRQHEDLKTISGWPRVFFRFRFLPTFVLFFFNT